MARILTALVLGAGVMIAGCSAKPHEPAAASTPDSGAASAPVSVTPGKTLYICHMGADCGKGEVGPGEKIPSCCGKEMVKAEIYRCRCGKTQVVAADKPAPVCCDAPMKKAQP